jgi:hypothetical protein
MIREEESFLLVAVRVSDVEAAVRFYRAAFEYAALVDDPHVCTITLGGTVRLRSSPRTPSSNTRAQPTKGARLVSSAWSTT